MFIPICSSTCSRLELEWPDPKGFDPGDVVEVSLLGCPTIGGPMGLGIIGDPGALFGLS